MHYTEQSVVFLMIVSGSIWHGAPQCLDMGATGPVWALQPQAVSKVTGQNMDLARSWSWLDNIFDFLWLSLSWQEAARLFWYFTCDTMYSKCVKQTSIVGYVWDLLGTKTNTPGSGGQACGQTPNKEQCCALYCSSVQPRALQNRTGSFRTEKYTLLPCSSLQ